jgi:hypothetical protein
LLCAVDGSTKPYFCTWLGDIEDVRTFLRRRANREALRALVYKLEETLRGNPEETRRIMEGVDILLDKWSVENQLKAAA